MNKKTVEVTVGPLMFHLGIQDLFDDLAEVQRFAQVIRGIMGVESFTTRDFMVTIRSDVNTRWVRNDVQDAVSRYIYTYHPDVRPYFQPAP